MTEQSPTLCVDFKKNRIRIHRRTLDMIGNPKYIQLLVNPSEARIAIRGSTAKDHLAHRLYDNGNCFELYSLNLMDNLRTVAAGMEAGHVYRLYGTVDRNSGTAVFSVKDPAALAAGEEYV